MRYLIINADDFGITEGVSNGIVDACEYGIVRSTTMFANTEHFEHGISLLKRTPRLGVGVHLTLTYGRPVLRKLQTIANSKGNFFKDAEFSHKLHSMDIKEILDEFTAQIEKIKKEGLEITHLDTHHHIHRYPKILAAVIQLAGDYGVGVRKVCELPDGIKTTQEFTDKFVAQDATELNLKMLLKKYEKAESLEIMCHPGRFDVELISKSHYAKKRETELSALTTYELQIYIEKMNVKIINYGELPE